MNSDWIFLSKNGSDEYVNAFAQGSGASVTNTDDFDYDASDQPIVIRGILKLKVHTTLAINPANYSMNTHHAILSV